MKPSFQQLNIENVFKWVKLRVLQRLKLNETTKTRMGQTPGFAEVKMKQQKLG
jgi:hypothetical protein